MCQIIDINLRISKSRYIEFLKKKVPGNKKSVGIYFSLYDLCAMAGSFAISFRVFFVYEDMPFCVAILCH